MSKKQTTEQKTPGVSNSTEATNQTGNNPAFNKDEFKEVQYVDEDGFSPTEEMNDYPKFHDFNTTPTFIGTFISPFESQPSKATGEIFQAHKFQGSDGIMVLLNKNYAIDQAVNKYGHKTYKITFTGYKPLDGGKKLKEFKIFIK